MSSTTTVETLPVGGGGGGGGGGGPFPGYRNAPISNSATPIPPQQVLIFIYVLIIRKTPRWIVID